MSDEALWRRLCGGAYNQAAAAYEPPEREAQMDREQALDLLTEVQKDERFAAVLCRVQTFAVGRAPTREYWCLRVARLEGPPFGWSYVDTPGDFHRLQAEAA